MNKYSLSALVAAGLLAGGLATSANAADLGGNCCADLEERIAELEATTARKGNRKVSLTISGWVGQQISFWDDGLESNTYIHDLGGTLGSHVKFTGSAQISPGWSAGYVLHLEAISRDGLTQTAAGQSTGSAFGNNGESVYALQSFWYVKSDQLGKVSLGKQSQASDNTAILVDGSGSLVPANWVAFDVNAFAIRNSNAALDGAAGNWGGVGRCVGGGAWGDCNGGTQNVVRYDSPTFGGFSVSASWGEDDMWDIAARYAGEHHGFKLAVAAAYNEIDAAQGLPSQALFGPGSTLTAGVEAEYFQIGAYLQHVATGLFLYGAYGNNDVSYDGGAFTLPPLGLGGPFPIDGSTYDSETFYIKAGLRTKFNHLGATVFYGEYENVEGDFAGAVALGGVVANEELDLWGLGVVQEIDAAAMSVWVKYRNMSYETTVNGTAIPGWQDFDYVGVGGLINF